MKPRITLISICNSWLFLTVRLLIVKPIKYTAFNGRYILTLQDSRQTRLTTGRNYQAQIKNWMDF